MLNFGQDVGIDLGTATVIVYVKGKGIVLKEVRVGGHEAVRPNLATAGHYTEYGIVKDFYSEASRHGYLCPVCGDRCRCSAKIAVVHITV